MSTNVVKKAAWSYGAKVLLWSLAALVTLPVLFIIGILVLVLAVSGGGIAGITAGPPTAYAQQTIPAALLPLYEAAGQKYGVPWSVLAAIHSIETGFCTQNCPTSYAGAEGPMQFEPATWSEYGVTPTGTGIPNIQDVQDAIYSAANMLAHDGYAVDPANAIMAYNHATWYVQEVLALAARFAGYQSAQPAGNWTWPTPTLRSATVTPGAGEIIIPGPIGTPVESATFGTVTWTGVLGASGLSVVITSPGGVSVRYVHLGTVQVQQGEQVQAGQAVGTIGSPGIGGPRLTLTVTVAGQPVNPAPYFPSPLP